MYPKRTIVEVLHGLKGLLRKISDFTRCHKYIHSMSKDEKTFCSYQRCFLTCYSVLLQFGKEMTILFKKKGNSMIQKVMYWKE